LAQLPISVSFDIICLLLIRLITPLGNYAKRGNVVYKFKPNEILKKIVYILILFSLTNCNQMSEIEKDVSTTQMIQGFVEAAVQA